MSRNKKSRHFHQTMPMEVATHVSSDRTFTTVGVVVGSVTGVGVAKRNTVDHYDHQVGYSLALSRALRDLADNLEVYP